MSHVYRLLFVFIVATGIGCSLAFFTGPAFGAEPTPVFVVTNKCPSSFTVDNKCPVLVTAPTVTYRAPHGHTHTCANGHSWDHDMDGGTHRCPVCGLSQFYQDSVPRMVAVRVSAPNAAPVYAWPSGTPNATYPPTSYPLTTSSFGSSGGCANGSCGVPSTGRRRLFP